MFLEGGDPMLRGGVVAAGDPSLRHHQHASPFGSLGRLSPQDSEFSDIDEFGRPCLMPGVADPHFQPSSIPPGRRR